MNIHQLTSFIAAAEAGSFSKAAEASFISTPGLLQQITLLERDLGFKLFDRSPAGVTLTRGGAHFYDAAKEILRLYEESKEYGQALGRQRSTVIRIGCTGGEIPPFLHGLCTAFENEHPDYAYSFQEAHYTKQLEGIAADEFDVVFLPHLQQIEKLGLRFTEAYRDPYVCCVSPHHPLANAELITLDDLHKETLYVERLYRGEAVMAKLEKDAAKRHLDITFDEEPFGPALALQVALGGGVIPCPARYAGNMVNLKSVPFDVEPSEYGLVSRWDASEPVQEFISFAAGFFV